MGYESFLSQDEVDALVAEVSGEPQEKPRDDPKPASGIRPYDLGSPDRVVRRRLQTLELINERFARNLRSVLLNFMRRSADISVGSLRIMKYEEFERNLPVPSNLNVVTMRPLRGMALFVFDPNLVFLVIDSLFGGSGRYHTRVEGREFTQTEQRIIRRLLGLTLDCYAQCWTHIYPVTFDYVRSEMHTKFASITGENEAVLVSSFKIDFGATGGALNICMPYSMIEPIRDLLTRPLQDVSLEEVDHRWTSLLQHEVRAADIDLVANFASIDTDLNHLMRLKVGDVLPFEMPGTVQACIDGVPVMNCDYGQYEGHYALRVRDPVSAPDDPNESTTSHD